MSYLIVEAYIFWFSLLLVPIYILRHQDFSIRQRILATIAYLALWLLITNILILYFDFWSIFWDAIW